MSPTTPPNLTSAGAILGTFRYMAPEQLEGHEADARTDLFAFGVVLFEMLTGQQAFASKTPAGVIGAIMRGDLPSVGIGGQLRPRSIEWSASVSRKIRTRDGRRLVT